MRLMIYKKVDPKKLLLSFPVILQTSMTFPLPDKAFSDHFVLRDWSENAKIGTSGKHVINLVASVIAGSTFSGEQQFDLFGALVQWDDAHQKAFKDWATEALS